MTHSQMPEWLRRATARNQAMKEFCDTHPEADVDDIMSFRMAWETEYDRTKQTEQGDAS
jgi:hypothetical protein